MAGRYPYYLLADSIEGHKKEAELTGKFVTEDEGAGTEDGGPRTAAGDLRRGFVYERVPHVTLKSIANNPDIQEGMTRE